MSVRARTRAALARVLSATGIDPRSARDILGDLGEHRLRLVSALLASFAAPLAEIGFIAMLYAMVEPAQQSTIVETLTRWNLTAPTVWFGGAQQLFAVTGAALLVVTIGAKYLSGYAHAYFLLATFITQARRVVQAYLFAPPSRVRTIDRARIASLAITEASHYGKVVFSLLDALSNASAATIFVLTAVVLSPGLAAVAAVLAALTLIVTSRGFAKQKEVGGRRVEVNAALMGGLWEILNGYRVVKVEGAERRLLQRLTADLRSKQAWRLDKARTDLFIRLGTEGTLYLALLVIVAVAVSVLTAPASLVLVFLVLMGRVQKYLGALQQAWIEVQHALPSLTAMADVVAQCAAAGVKPLTSAEGGVRPRGIDMAFENVTFHYDPQKPIVADLTLRLPPGECVLIQGRSGEGKSTLLFLACGLLAPVRGEVRLNGEPLTDDLFYRLRSFLTYVAPNNYLFRGSIRENLCLGVDYPEAEIHAALDRARLKGLVQRFSGGIDGDIGEDGAHLSLGERQRVMLARIFLKRPLLILLDEATANLDLENERELLRELLANIDPSATVLMVTHRPPLNVAFTRVYDLVEGRLRLRSVVEPGVASAQ